jgi:hypothetical protein
VQFGVIPSIAVSDRIWAATMGTGSSHTGTRTSGRPPMSDGGETLARASRGRLR